MRGIWNYFRKFATNSGKMNTQLYKPEMYTKPGLYTNNLSVDAFDFVMDKLDNVIKLDQLVNCNIIDVACGDGNATCRLLSYIKPCNHVTACDIEPNLIEYCKTRNQYKNLDFIQMDAQGVVPDELRGKFDLLFSCLFLHWSTNHKIALSNFQKLLKKNGRIAVYFFPRLYVWDCYRELYKVSKYKQYMSDIENFINPYNDCNIDEAKSKFTNSMIEAGFRDITVDYCDNLNYYWTDIEVFKSVHTAVNPFVARMPNDIANSFMNDYVNLHMKRGDLKQVKNFVARRAAIYTISLLISTAFK